MKSSQPRQTSETTDAICGPMPRPTPSTNAARFAGTTVSAVAYAKKSSSGAYGGRRPASRADACVERSLDEIQDDGSALRPQRVDHHLHEGLTRAGEEDLVRVDLGADTRGDERRRDAGKSHEEERDDDARSREDPLDTQTRRANQHGERLDARDHALTMRQRAPR